MGIGVVSFILDHVLLLLAAVLVWLPYTRLTSRIVDRIIVRLGL